MSRTLTGSTLLRAVTLACVLADIPAATAQPFPSGGSPNPAMTGTSTGPSAARPSAPVVATAGTQDSTQDSPDPSAATAPPAPPPAIAPVPGAAPVVAPPPSNAAAPSNIPRAVTVARATVIPRCTSFVDAAGAGAGTAQSPHKTITAAVAAAPPGAVICVAEGVYAEQLKPGEKHFTLAGGFQRGSNFTVRDSARYVSKAQGRGGSFFRVQDTGPKDQLTAIDGFEITGYEQAIFRDYYESQRFDIVNNYIHGNKCGDDLVGAGVSLTNVSGRVQGNVFRNNSCGRAGALSVQDTEQKNTLLVANNLVDNNHGTEPVASHGGALYLFGKTLTVTGNLMTNNSVTKWGAALYVGAWTEGKLFTTATMSWNVYRGNKAGNGGGGLFCDEGATCISEHEIYDRNCGSNVYLDGGSEDSGPTTARISHMTNVGALDPGCGAPGPGIRIDKNAGAPDNYSITNSLFWGNAPGKDFAYACDVNCDALKIIVTHSMVQTNYALLGKGKITFGSGIVAPVDPLFAAPDQGDFHLKSTAGRWTPGGYVQDPAMSPALAKADPGSPSDKNPPRAGKRNELGAYGNSVEASNSQ